MQDIREIAECLGETIQKGGSLAAKEDMSLRALIKEHKRLTAVLASGSEQERHAEYRKQKAELERYIKRKRGEPLVKALSFDPESPHVMGENSSFYSPYQRLPDGSYAPYPTAHWTSMSAHDFGDGEFGARVFVGEPDYQRATRFDGYNETEKFYARAGVRKALYAEIDTLIKAEIPDGVVHEWNGVKFKKTKDGWHPVHDGAKVHPISQHYTRRLTKLQNEIKARTSGLRREPGFDDRARALNQKHAELETMEKEAGAREEAMRAADLERREQEVASHKEKVDEEKKRLKPEYGDTKPYGDHKKCVRELSTANHETLSETHYKHVDTAAEAGDVGLMEKHSRLGQMHALYAAGHHEDAEQYHEKSKSRSKSHVQK